MYKEYPQQPLYFLNSGSILLWDILSRGCLGFSAGAALSAFAGRPRLGFSSVCSLTGFFSGDVSSFAGALFLAALKSSTFGAGTAFPRAGFLPWGRAALSVQLPPRGPVAHREPVALALGEYP